MKKYILSAFAVILAIGFTAFTTAKKDATHRYIPTVVTWELITNMDSYDTDLEFADCGLGSSVPCQVDLNEFSDIEDFIQYLQTFNNNKPQGIQEFLNRQDGFKD
jgi:hypothetical protein